MLLSRKLVLATLNYMLKGIFAGIFSLNIIVIVSFQAEPGGPLGHLWFCGGYKNKKVGPLSYLFSLKLTNLTKPKLMKKNVLQR